MSSISPMTPDDFEKMSVGTESRSQSQRPSSVSSDSWYLNKRNSRSSRRESNDDSSSITPSDAAAKPLKDDKLTPLPPSMEVSLAILTSGLSVAAFHAVKSISEKRAAKKLKASQNQQIELSRAQSVLVPSSIPEQAVAPLELEAEPVAELDGSPLDLPPAYSVDVSRSASGKKS